MGRPTAGEIQEIAPFRPPAVTDADDDRDPVQPQDLRYRESVATLYEQQLPVARDVAPDGTARTDGGNGVVSVVPERVRVLNTH